jgi:GNAT superfamily N-acetyltransferase
MSYTIREVDGSDEEIADALADLHRLTFFASARVPDFSHGWWWLAHFGATAAAFAGVVPATREPNAGYFSRVGVLPRFHGNGLQRRLMRAIELRGRRLGWDAIVSDTTDNIPSANNFIRAGYHLYQPENPWSLSQALYWRKLL